MHQTRPSAPFLPILFRQDGKEWAVGDIPSLQICKNISNSKKEPHVKTVYFRDPTKENIEAAAKIIRDGGLLAIPTETVYGLGADAR